jgi:hypothetical protein
VQTRASQAIREGNTTKALFSPVGLSTVGAKGTNAFGNRSETASTWRTSCSISAGGSVRPGGESKRLLYGFEQCVVGALWRHQHPSSIDDAKHCKHEKGPKARDPSALEGLCRAKQFADFGSKLGLRIGLAKPG